MSITTRLRAIPLACFTVAASAAAPRAGAQAPLAGVAEALGRAGADQPGGVVRFSFPRSDLTVVANGVTLKPALALGSWVAFEPMEPHTATAMGDLVLLEAEVGGVMRALQAGGVEQTALHNHVLGESPRVMYMHVSAHGDPVKIAQTIRTALATTKTPLGTPAAPAAPSAAELDTAGVATALGVAGKLNGVVYQVSVPRRERIMERGHEVPPSMGVATAINFQPTGGGKAAITGDFVMRAEEVNAVIRALQAHGINPTALHSHMLDESPRLFFMHFWANDDAVTLAKGLRAALDHTASKIGR
ncbi:MAG: DUF1259 domain-containing protein [Gemmatimonadaceae bacterium]